MFIVKCCLISSLWAFGIRMMQMLVLNALQFNIVFGIKTKKNYKLIEPLLSKVELKYNSSKRE
jgi:hypothetical protein